MLYDLGLQTPTDRFPDRLASKYAQIHHSGDKVHCDRERVHYSGSEGKSGGKQCAIDGLNGYKY